MGECKFKFICCKCGAVTELGGQSCDTTYTEGNICLNVFVDDFTGQNYIEFKCTECGNECKIKNRIFFLR